MVDHTKVRELVMLHELRLRIRDYSSLLQIGHAHPDDEPRYATAMAVAKAAGADIVFGQFDDSKALGVLCVGVDNRPSLWTGIKPLYPVKSVVLDIQDTPIPDLPKHWIEQGHSPERVAGNSIELISMMHTMRKIMTVRANDASLPSADKSKAADRQRMMIDEMRRFRVALAVNHVRLT